jgi:hypothetical protein
MEQTKAISIEDFAALHSVTVESVKELKPQLKQGRHWVIGRYKKTMLTPAGQKKVLELLVIDNATVEAPEAPEASELPMGSQEVDVVELPVTELPPVAPQSGLARLLSESDTATVLVTRMPNLKLLKVNYKGEERICKCRDSRYFVPGMVTPVRLDGDTLIAKFQPRRLGKF